MTREAEGLTQIRVGFVLTGHGVLPDYITSELGLQPSVTWREGQRRVARSPLLHDADGWAIRTDAEIILDLGSHIKRILDRVHPLAGKIRKLCQDHKLTAEIECDVRIVGEEVQNVPIMFFQSDDIKRIADLGADIDIDINLVAPSDR